MPSTKKRDNLTNSSKESKKPGSSKGVSSKGISKKQVSSKGVSSKSVSSKSVSSKGISSKGVSSKNVSSKGISSKNVSSKGISKKSSKQSKPISHTQLIIDTEERILEQLTPTEKYNISHEPESIAADITNKHGNITTSGKMEQSTISTLSKLKKAVDLKSNYQVAKYSLTIMALLAVMAGGTYSYDKEVFNNVSKTVGNLLDTNNITSPISKILYSLYQYCTGSVTNSTIYAISTNPANSTNSIQTYYNDKYTNGANFINESNAKLDALEVPTFEVNKEADFVKKTKTVIIKASEIMKEACTIGSYNIIEKSANKIADVANNLTAEKRKNEKINLTNFLTETEQNNINTAIDLGIFCESKKNVGYTFTQPLSVLAKNAMTIIYNAMTKNLENPNK